MYEYFEPKGINFSCSKEIDSFELAKNLLIVVSFLQYATPKAELCKYDDWWEHDGLHFNNGETDFEELLKMVAKNELLKRFRFSDFNVFTGIAPKDNAWYLRFYLDEEENIGRFDITIPNELTEIFEKEVLNNLTLELKQQSSATYYKSIICY